MPCTFLCRCLEALRWLEIEVDWAFNPIDGLVVVLFALSRHESKFGRAVNWVTPLKWRRGMLYLFDFYVESTRTRSGQRLIHNFNLIPWGKEALKSRINLCVSSNPAVFKLINKLPQGRPAF